MTDRFVKYSKIKRLGEGFFGEVWLAYSRPLAANVALKIIRPDSIYNRRNFFAEAQTLHLLTHPNIVQVKDAGKFENGSIYIAMEYLEKGSVHDKAQGMPLKISLARDIICDVLRGLEYAHVNNKIIHHDIKPANILYGDDGKAKLSDFGLATRIDDKKFTSPAGMYYLTHCAPEIVQGRSATVSSDIYAVGVTLYRLINGDDYLPSYPTKADIKQAIKMGEYPPREKWRLYVSRDLRYVINKALSINPEERYKTASDLRHALEQVDIVCDWTEKYANNYCEWQTKINGTNISIRLSQETNGTFSVTTRKGKSSPTMRNVTRFCKGRFKKIETATEQVSRALKNFGSG